MQKPVQVPKNYHCPFCPDHKDDTFFDNILVGQPICEGCSVELDIFCESKERPDDFLIDKLENHIGLSWRECRKVLLEKNLAEWQKLAETQPQSWVASTMKICGWTREQTITYIHQQVENSRLMLADL